MAFMPRFALPDSDAPQPVGKRYGLLTAAAGPVVMPSKAQGGGITYYPTSCGSTRQYGVECGPDDSPGDESPGDIKIFDGGTPFTDGDPFTLYSSLQCGSAGLGALAQDAVDTIDRRLRLRFDSGLAAGVEAATAVLFAASGAPELVAANSADIVAVVGTLEQWLYGRMAVDTSGGGTSAGQGYGYRGYIHTTFRAFDYMKSEHLIEPDPDNRRLWVTPTGTIVVPGAYSGALPGDGAAQAGVDAVWITGQFTVWESPDTIQPDLRQTFDRTTNQWMALIERIYMVTWDCAIAAAPFDWEGATSL